MASEKAKAEDKKQKYSPARWVGSPNIKKIRDQFLAILKREAGRLMDESYKGQLSEESRKCLINYLKLVRDLSERAEEETEDSSDKEQSETEPFADLSTEELKKMAKSQNQGGKNA